MDDQFKVCGNCGHCTMADGKYVCIDPAKPAQKVVAMGAREPCFVVTSLTPEQARRAALAPAETSTMH